MKPESVGQLFDIVTRLLRQYAFSYWSSDQSVIQLVEERRGRHDPSTQEDGMGWDCGRALSGVGGQSA
jgi:hypothetical protein